MRSFIKIKKSKTVYKGSRIQLLVEEIQVKDHKKTLKREVIKHPDVAVIVPQFKNKKLILVRQHRYAVNKYFWEFPAGTCDGKEKPLTCAKRELVEETNHSAKSFKKLLSFYPTPGISTEHMHLFLATDLYPKQGQPDEDEFLEVQAFSLNQVNTMIRSGKIKDGKTILAALYLSKR